MKKLTLVGLVVALACLSGCGEDETVNPTISAPVTTPGAPVLKATANCWNCNKGIIQPFEASDCATLTELVWAWITSEKAAGYTCDPHPISADCALPKP